MRIFRRSLLALAMILTISCGSTKEPINGTPEEIYNFAVKAYNDEDYQTAKKYFDVIKLQYPASQWADDAQYYMSETNFKQEEYILGAFNYNLLRRVYPASPYSKISLYKAALCYEQLSPSYDRDQEYTKKAIETFQEYQYLYPEDSLYKEASEKIKDMRNKLAHRQYSTAVIYRKLGSPHSSLIYYDEVINNFDDTDYFEPALFGKIDALYEMRRYEQIKGIANLYKAKFPDGANVGRIDDIMEKVNSQIR